MALAPNAFKRNTPVWAINRLRSDAIPALLNDLSNAGNEGYTEDICAVVAGTLRELTNEAAGIPDKSIWRKSIYDSVQAFEDRYIEWNDINGSDENAQSKRKNLLKKLRVERQNIAMTVRENCHIINNELDLKLIDRTYNGLGRLVEKAPEIFSNLAKAIARYFKRRSGD